MEKTVEKKENYPVWFSICTLAILTVSLCITQHRQVWAEEVAPIIIGFPILFFTYRKFQFTNFVYAWLIIHFVILNIGGIYTYAKAPLGYWMQDWFGFSRNNYDKIGHFAQGFIPAILIREVLLRISPLQRGKLLFFIITAICLAISAFYEIAEWWVACVQGADAEDFLGTQGYVWDAQSDMLFALLGAVFALLALSKIHDKHIDLKIKIVNYEE
ncbi:MAG: DUF2238 domain-containing protein [Bacteroidales bacterium]|nr:DUF2238 domain-containing protein [Bacteroidales bacterium]